MSDRERWNGRYTAGEYPREPDEWLMQRTELLRPDHNGARALDLACGAGRHTLFLAGMGYEIDAWDISEVGLELLQHALLAEQPRDGRPLKVNPRQVDLETVDLPMHAYDLVLDLYFLDRRLLRQIPGALRPGGLVVVRTLMRRATGEDRNTFHLLGPGELRQRFSALEQLEYAEDPVAGWTAVAARQRTAPTS